MNSDKKRILVVDDEPSITRLLRLNLEETGLFVVATENNSRQAVATAERFEPHLILLDVMMPGLDGGTLSSTLQADPKLKAVPVVFLTAAVTKKEVRDRRGLVGGLSFLAKPVDLAEVLTCLTCHLRLAPPSPATGLDPEA